MSDPRPSDKGSAVVDFVLIMVLLIPLVLGIIQVGLVLHVRNTVTAAVSEGARYAAAANTGPASGAERARRLIRASLDDRYAAGITATVSRRGGRVYNVVRAHLEVPALGLGGPAVQLDVAGHASEEIIE